MLHLAFVFVLAQTQMQLDESADARARTAISRMDTAYRHAREVIGNDPRLARTQRLWLTMRDATCGYERALVGDGSMLPMIDAQCASALAADRASYLRRVADRSRPRRALEAVRTATDARLRHVYGAIASRLDPSERASLLRSEIAWLRYRDAACALEGGACLTTMERERTKSLEDSWLGDPVW